MKLKLFFCLFWIQTISYSQFKFVGNVNDTYTGATAYLSLVEDCNKKALFFTESIIQESTINEDGFFFFKGDFLEKNNRIYKIYIHNCQDNISDYKHLLNHCKDSKEILFIANNEDTIDFPLNDLSQIFCEVVQSNPSSNAIIKIEELQENILTNLQNLKSDRQRKNVYQRHFKEIQEFSKQFDEPLAEVYAYYLYANENFLSREYYIKDLKNSKYYNNLLLRLEDKYPNSTHTKLYRSALIKDQYSFLVSKNTTYKITAIVLACLLVLSLLYIVYLSKKKIVNPVEVIDYTELLTAQEQKVFKLMLENSNKEIADKLFISLSTVKTHINNIYSKLSIRSRKEIPAFLG